MRHALTFLYATLLLLVAPACGGGGSVVVGLTSTLRVGVDIDQVHVVMRAAGAVVTDEILSTSSAAHPLVLPTELRFTDLPGGTAVEVTLEAFAPSNTATPLLTRLAATTIVAGETLLLPVVLDSRCIPGPTSSAPVCAEPETCIAGICKSESVAAGTLEPYSPAWSSASTDPCKPSGGGAPVVMVGEGQADYLPLANGAVDQVEQGPQGGHHVWVALRAKNLSQSGSITSVSGTFPGLGVDVGPFNVIFTMEIDEGGYCKLYGLRFQLDQKVSIQTLLGRPLDMTVTVTDPEMAVGVGKLSVVLSQTYLQ